MIIRTVTGSHMQPIYVRVKGHRVTHAQSNTWVQRNGYVAEPAYWNRCWIGRYRRCDQFYLVQWYESVSTVGMRDLQELQMYRMQCIKGSIRPLWSKGP